MYNHTYGLNIHVVDFTLNNSLCKENDSIRVSITTIPEHYKQSYKIHKADCKKFNHVFSVNITDETKRIIVVFRKKKMLSTNPIIASTIIHSKDFPEKPDQFDRYGFCSTKQTDLQTLNIFEPLQTADPNYTPINYEAQDTTNGKINRRIVGEMNIQLSLSTPYAEFEDKNKSHQSKNNNKVSSKPKTEYTWTEKPPKKSIRPSTKFTKTTTENTKYNRFDDNFF